MQFYNSHIVIRITGIILGCYLVLYAAYFELEDWQCPYPCTSEQHEDYDRRADEKGYSSFPILQPKREHGHVWKVFDI
jgi:hypothetical protein